MTIDVCLFDQPTSISVSPFSNRLLIAIAHRPTISSFFTLSKPPTLPLLPPTHHQSHDDITTVADEDCDIKCLMGPSSPSDARFILTHYLVQKIAMWCWTHGGVQTDIHIALGVDPSEWVKQSDCDKVRNELDQVATEVGRNIRQMDYNQVLADDDYDDDYYEDTYDPDDIDAAIAQVKSVLGEDIDVTDDEIRDAVCYYALDTEQAIDWIFSTEKNKRFDEMGEEEMAKKAKKKAKKTATVKAEEKEKVASTAKEENKSMENNDNYKEKGMCNGEGGGSDEKVSSIQSALASLKSLKVSSITTTTTISRPGLTLSSIKQPSLGGVDLKSLAPSSGNAKIDLKSLASSHAPALSSIASLQPNRMPSLSSSTVKLPSLSSFKLSTPVKPSELPSQKSHPETVTNQLPEPASPRDSSTNDVPPSEFAKALFDNEDSTDTTDTLLSSHFSTLSIFPPSHLFDFSTPSPDDIIASARGPIHTSS